MPDKARVLQRKRALQAAGRMEHLLDEGIDTLVDLLRSDETDPKIKLGIVKFFAESSRLRSRVEQELGLGKIAKKADDHPLIAVFGGNVQVFKNLPAEKRREMVLKALKGETAPQ